MFTIYKHSDETGATYASGPLTVATVATRAGAEALVNDTHYTYARGEFTPKGTDYYHKHGGWITIT